MLFIPNKYTRIYYSICSRARKENRNKKSGTYEAHHFLPKAIFPQFENYNKYKWNKVLLTPKEHFICHLLLTRMFEGKDRSRMCLPVHRMAIKTGRDYEVLRKMAAKASSDLQKGITKSPEAIEKMAAAKRGKPSPLKGRTMSMDAKQKMSAAKKGRTALNKGVVYNETVRRNMAASKIGKPLSEDHKEKIRRGLRRAMEF